MRGPAVHPIVIAAGGTGGHFFPAEALAATLIARGHRVVLMTDARTGARVGGVFGAGEHHVLRGAGIAGRGGLRAVGAILSLAAGVAQARALLARLDAAVIVGFGGYPSVPPVLGARLLRRRPAVILHEQNAVLGRANRFLAPHANMLALGFANTAGVNKRMSVRVVGNPVRPPIRALSGIPYAAPAERIRILVSGGSLGARVFSDVVPQAIALLPGEQRQRLDVVQQCRAEDIERVRLAYSQAGVQAELSPFFPDMAERLAAAQFVIARAGASTCAELAVAGRPALLVPLPGAIDDHQTANARAIDGAHLVPQPMFTPAHLAALLTDGRLHPASLLVAALRIAACGHPDASDDLADLVESLASRVGTPR